MLKIIRSTMLVPMFLLWAAAAAGADLQVGSWVELRAANEAGVPLHERDESSMKGRLADGTRAKVLALGQKGWIQIQTSDGQTGWIVRRYVGAVIDDGGAPHQPQGAKPPEPSPRPEAKAAGSPSYGGLPRNVRHPCRDIEVLKNEGFIVGYCEEKKDPAWVVYRLFPIEEVTILPRPQFRPDLRTQAKVEPRHYTRSGYDRGHMAPNFAISTRFGADGQNETFLMSNIVPQAPGINQGVWQKIEHLVAEEYAQKLGEVWVIVGPIFDGSPQTLPSGVEIPDGFFMIVVDELAGAPRALTWLVPHSASGEEPMESFLTSIDKVEEATGLDFLSELPDRVEKPLEAQAERQLWSP